MTSPETLMRVIRQVPGVNSVRRWQRGAQDRAYILFSVSVPEKRVYVDLRCGVLFGAFRWQADPNDLGARAMKTIRELCEQYRAERAPVGAGR